MQTEQQSNRFESYRLTLVKLREKVIPELIEAQKASYAIYRLYENRAYRFDTDEIIKSQQRKAKCYKKAETLRDMLYLIDTALRENLGEEECRTLL